MVSWRRRVLFVALALLLGLDLGRSLYARVGAISPTRRLQPAATYARPIAWPPGRDLPASASLGARVYAEHCAVCHGPDGHGNGPASPSLHPRPRDFTGGVFKLKSTGAGNGPALDDVRETIRRGMPGTSMPGWDDVLSDAEIDAAAGYVRDLGPHREWAPAIALPVSDAALANASPAEGARLYADLGCPACHGAEGRGNGGSANALKDVWNQADPPRDLTAPWEFRSRREPATIYRVIADGMSGTPMPGYAEVATPDQIAAIVAYVGSLARRPLWESAAGSDRAVAVDPVQRGQYLVHAGMCGLCHTPVDDAGIYIADTHYLAGGMRITAGAHGVFFSRNLTADVATGLGAWTVEEIAAAIRTGRTRARRLNYWAMPWMVFHRFTAEDATAIASYLKTLSPVRNLIPPPLHYGSLETVVRKALSSWPALPPERLTYAAGNYGDDDTRTVARDLPQRVLVWGERLVFALGLLILFASRPGSEQRSLGLSLIVGVWMLVAMVAWLVIDRYPALDALPAESVAAGFASGVPELHRVDLPEPQQAFLTRGRYLYGVASCPFCHNGDGGGGAKVNWAAFGTTWSRNLTAHATGLAAWSDAAIQRALASGVSRDGRALHWQAMIWDHLSNYSIEDQRALVAFVRTLPSIERALPAAIGPRPDDCADYSFWTDGNSTEPGCR